ncbi:NAD(+) synthase [Mesoterricola sediminis]|uniref:Glutamine-dependent NAD(+) synthetase n=1 Tax=Mesoterricola sediminis TaxID=2927980 RepID=A0AA48KCM9_9BACT|nr:NAD(+) synthase [Mesoterricola sediminis]BDU76220.1 NAD+ synthase [Mesoterricola sediminis]
MRIALLQLNSRLGDPEANGRALEAAYREAVGRGADLVLSAEMAVGGYLAEDRLWEQALRRAVVAESERLAAASGPVPLVFGTCTPSPSGRLWNELWWCESGAVRARARKRILPAYDVFDESRYFDADLELQPLVDYRGERVGLSVCEDLWASAELAPGPIRYPFDPIADLAGQGATLILNASASPGHLGSYLPPGRTAPWQAPSKLALRRRLLQGHAARHGVPIAYASRVGSESWLTFDGGSGLVQPDGTWQGDDFFEEGVVMTDSAVQGRPWPAEPREEAWLRRALTIGLRENMAKQGLEAAVVGLSGGIDSSVVAAVAAEALGPDRVLGIALPTRFTSAESLTLAREQADALGIPFLQLDAGQPFEGAARALGAAFPDRAFGLTDENFQSRCRGMLLMGATSEPGVHRLLGTPRVAVLNTGNKSEAATGYFTLYGDGIGAFGILGDCLKARVFALARELGPAIPRGILERKPTAELRPDQTDETSLMPYRQLDAVLGILLEARREEAQIREDLACALEGADLEQARNALPRVFALLRNSEFKRRQLPFCLKVSPWAFGRGRRIPLTAK